jgi:hypothetical protein
MGTQIAEGNSIGPSIAGTLFAENIGSKPLDSSLLRDCSVTERQLRYIFP